MTPMPPMRIDPIGDFIGDDQAERAVFMDRR